MQIYDGGLMGMGGGIYYLGHPVQFNGAEIEGGPYTPVVDTTTSLAVDVLGGTPSVGDILIATGVGGRWVAERGGGSGPPTGPSCGGCTIPNGNLNLSWIFSAPLPPQSGSTTLTQLGATWYSPVTTDFNPPYTGYVAYTIFCAGGAWQFRVWGSSTSNPVPASVLNGWSLQFSTWSVDTVHGGGGAPFGVAMNNFVCSPLDWAIGANPVPAFEYQWTVTL